MGVNIPRILAVAYYGTLVGDVTASASSLTVAPYPGTLLEERVWEAAIPTNGRLVIGNELLTYGSRQGSADNFVLSNLSRAQYGTTAASHAAGTRVGRLIAPAYSGEYTAALKLMYDVLAPRLASKMDLGLGSLSFDGSEWLSHSHGSLGQNLAMEQVFNSLADNENFVHDAANVMPYTWHINSRFNWGETEDDIRTAHQRYRWAKPGVFPAQSDSTVAGLVEHRQRQRVALGAGQIGGIRCRLRVFRRRRGSE